MRDSNIGGLISIYGTKIWNLVAVFIFIPIYIKILGIEYYAVIGFYTLLLGIISFVDSGMSSAILKEFSLKKQNSYKFSLLRKTENLYVLICFSIMLLIFLFSNVIAVKWLSSDKIATDDLSYYISLIGFGVTVQLLSSLYYGALFGLNEQIKANCYQIIWNILKAGVVILVLIYFKPNLEVYFIWQIICNLVYVFILRYNVICKLKSNRETINNYLPKIPKHILKYIGGVTLIGIISAINSQADKIIVSTFFSLKTFGYYNIASIISQIPVVLGSPLGLFIFPIFSKFSEDFNSEKLIISFKKISFLLHIIVMPATFILILYTTEIMSLWTGNAIEDIILPKLLLTVKLLALGSLFLAMQFPLIYLLLAKGKTKYTVIQGFGQIVFGLPILYLCAKYFDLESIGIPWILINFVSLIYLTSIVFKMYVKINYYVFFKESILIPLLITSFFAFVFYLFFLKVNSFFYMFAIFTGIIALVTNIIYSNYKNNLKLFNLNSLYNFPN